MSLSAIVTALRTTVSGVSGIDNCYPRIPETKPGDTTFAVIQSGTSTREPQTADMERIEYPIDLYVMTKRSGALWAEQDTVLPFVDSVPTALRSAFTLGGLTYGTQYADPATELVDIQIDDQSYLGIVFHLRYKQKITVTYSG